MFRTYEPARDRLVAIKVFRLDLTPEQAHALADELQRVADANLEHPSIVRPLGAGVEGTLAYAASEYVAAESLDVALKHYAPAALEKVLPFITQLAGAIDFARTAGIGLGALHPRDIFVTPDEARATGFGVVQALERLGVRAPVRRPYTAPERVAGGEWDARADVYSLGAIAFELLTARRPVGPDVADLGNTAGRYGDVVAEAISRALAGDPAHRYPSALACAAALEAASHGERTTGAIADVQAVAGTDGAIAAPPVDHEPARDARVLVVEPDVEIERDEDEAEIQLREREAFAREAEDVHAEPDAEPLPDVPAQPEREAEPELRFTEPQAEQTPEPSLFDFEPEVEQQPQKASRATRVPEEPLPAAVFPPGPDLAPPTFDGYPPPRREPPTVTRRPRPVFLPVALTLLLGLFVGFLAGYLVGSRDPNVVSPSGAEAGAERSGASASDSPVGPDRAAPSVPRAAPQVGTPAPQATRPTPQVTKPAPQAPASRPAASPARPAPARGRLMVRSTPAGAQVFVNGRRRGTTPLAIRDLAPGTYTLRVTRSGFEEQSRKVTVNSAGVREVNLRLEASRPAPPVSSTGSIYVDSRPRGARVFLDGTEIGTTPMQASSIRAGAHVVRLELQDHRTWTASARVVGGEVTRVTGSLER